MMPDDVYTITVAATSGELSGMVNLMIKQGWRPIGGVTYMPGGQIAQALTRDRKK